MYVYMYNVYTVNERGVSIEKTFEINNGYVE